MAALCLNPRKAVVDVAVLEKTNEQLQKENEDLKVILKRYLDGISIHPDVLDTPNPLLVVNSREPPSIKIVEGEVGNSMEQASHVIQIRTGQ